MLPESVSAVTAAVNMLTRIRPDARFRIHAIPMREAANGPATSLTVVGELPTGMQGWAQGGTVTSSSPEPPRSRLPVTLKPR